MKAYRILFLLPALIAALYLLPADRVAAQIFTVLHSFSGDPITGPQQFYRLVQ